MRIGIIGLGLIGGSLGMALRALKNSPPPLGEGRVGAVEVVGVARTPEAAAEAQRRGAVDQASTDPTSLIGTDLVVIATPIDQVRSTIERIAPVMGSGTLITDVTSVKRSVLEWARRLPHPAHFLGGHPVAGKAESGLAAADAGLFRDEPWIFTPRPDQNLVPFSPWFELVRAIGARPVFLSAEEHDRQMAHLSHLAFTLSAAFAEAVDENADPGLGGPGYRSMTRLAAGDPAMYESISRENRAALVAAIDSLRLILDRYRDRIENGELLHELFERQPLPSRVHEGRR
ncbi:MAG TPA: prephenate dehydrogenase/arogenate dehydrogenase family protein [Candidatus Acidoferrum sp.]|nr:prephenate dehydrogenase/arogenate dehydrogenase family protein [Candidatus Acidoferrum sp.]